MKSALLLLLPFCFVVAACNSAPSSPEERAKQAKAEKRFHTVAGGAVMLRDRMREPESLKFSSVIAMDDGTACYDYRARNGFGGMDGGSAILLSGVILVTPEENDSRFRKEWNKVCAHRTGADLTEDMNYAIEQAAP